MLVDEILEIADDATRDQCINLQGKTVLNNQAISRARLRIDTRKWLVGKLLPKIYGNRVEYHSHVSSIQKEGLDELSNYIEELERKYHREY